MPTIKLSDYNIPATLPEQAEKVQEEWEELVEAYKRFTLAQVGSADLSHVEEEAFDLMEAVLRFLVKHGSNVDDANVRHLKKLQGRHGDVRKPF